MIHFIIVSHGHDDYIYNLLNSLDDIYSQDFQFYIKDNIGSVDLKKYCNERNIDYLYSGKAKGFAANNNEMVDFISKKSVDWERDYFIFLNPDIILTDDSISKLVKVHKENKYDLFCVDLFKDLEYLHRDPSVRHFPKPWDFFTSYLFNFNKSIINRDNIEVITRVDWFAGSFLAIKSNVFKAIQGFDEAYFMYCEDLDLCLRAHKNGFKAYYLPDIKVVHFTQHQNRKLFNQHMSWHLKSIFILYLKNFYYLIKHSR
ncbi:glycosyltransferase family 2 protein [Pantoea agglomerans]|uniref:glycosyltransferase family 2 protein n=1 Tax=Enterobacter agglomerans TaxID=549 RepID=UPI00320926EB